MIVLRVLSKRNTKISIALPTLTAPHQHRQRKTSSRPKNLQGFLWWCSGKLKTSFDSLHLSTTTTQPKRPPKATLLPSRHPPDDNKPQVKIYLLLPRMSDNGEIEVEAVSGYQVLPKDVVAEIGSIKLFNKWSYDDVEIRDISLT